MDQFRYLQEFLLLVIKLIRKVNMSIWILIIIMFSAVITHTAGPSSQLPVSILTALLFWWIFNYKYQNLMSPPKLEGKIICAGDFHWISFDAKGTPKALKPKRESSGLMWEGYAVGISLENGKVGSIAVWLFGSNYGVGHYTYMDKTDRIGVHHGDGHFNLKVYAKENKSWSSFVLHSGCERVAKDVQRFYRPVITTYDERNATIRWYDDESGREVFINERRKNSKNDLFLFGPYPKKQKNFIGRIAQPGLIITPVERTDNDCHKQIIVDVRDIYGNLLEHTYVSIEGIESDYRFGQLLPSNGKSIAISVPQGITRFSIHVRRGGYGKINSEVDLQFRNIRVRAILEPLR